MRILSGRLSVAIACSVIAGSLHAQDKVALRLDVQPGQAWKFDRSYDMELNSKGTAGGQTKTDSNKMHQRRIGSIEILAASNGKPTSVRITYGQECENSMESNGRSAKPPFPYAGQTVTVTRGEDGSIQSDFRGQADQNSMMELKSVVEPDVSLYPEKEVAVGDEWKGDPQIVNKQLEITGPKDSGGMTMKLVSVKNINGRATAELEVATDATKDMGGVTRKTESKASVLVDVKTGHIMKFEQKGTSSIAGTATNRGQNGKTIQVRWDGDGTMTMTLTSELMGGAPGDVGSNLPANPNTVMPGAGPKRNPFSTGAPPVTPNTPQPPAQASAPAAAGEMNRFEFYSLMDDPSYIGGEVGRYLIPAGWKAEGSVHWDLACTFPAQIKLVVYDPKSPSAFAQFPGMMFWWQQDRESPMYPHPKLGSHYAGGIVRPPVNDAVTAIMEVVIPEYRKELAHARVVSKEKMPKLAKQVFDNSFGMPGQQQTVYAAKIRFEYEVKGVAVEEDVTAALVLRPNQQFKTIEWRVVAVLCTRGPKGSLDELKMLRLAMQKSTAPNIQWYNKLYQWAETMNRMKIKEIEATAERSRIFAQMTNEINDARKKQFEDYQKTTSAQALAFDQYIRDVTPYNSTQPGSPPIELPSGYSHNWQGANGQIIQTNNANYNPSQDPTNPNTNWTPMQQQH